MIPTLFTASVMIAPGSGLISSGYVAGNTLGAQNFNWYLYHLTAELNNVLTGVGITQLSTDDQQLMKAVGRAQVSVTATGTTTASAFTGDTWVKFNNSAGAATYDISAGAARAGIVLIIEEIHANGVTIQTGTSQTALLGVGSVSLLWDGAAWTKIGGARFRVAFTSGSAVAWKTPWRGTFEATLTGGGGGSGGLNQSGAGISASGAGGGGGTAKKVFFETQGASLTYTVGSGGTAGTTAPTSGGNGGDSTITDGVITVTAGGGVGGQGLATAGGQYSGGSAGGVATGGDINIPGGNSGRGFPISPNAIPATGGMSIYSPVSPDDASSQAGVAGLVYGGGARGAWIPSAGSRAGAAGAGGLVVIEF